MGKVKEEEKPKEWPVKRVVDDWPPKSTLLDRLAKIDGLTLQQAEEMALHGVPDDLFVIQTKYRITGQAAQEALKVFEEEKK